MSYTLAHWNPRHRYYTASSGNTSQDRVATGTGTRGFHLEYITITHSCAFYCLGIRHSFLFTEWKRSHDHCFAHQVAFDHRSPVTTYISISPWCSDLLSDFPTFKSYGRCKTPTTCDTKGKRITKGHLPHNHHRRHSNSHELHKIAPTRMSRMPSNHNPIANPKTSHPPRLIFIHGIRRPCHLMRPESPRSQ